MSDCQLGRPTGLSITEIMILLHYYCMGEDYPGIQANGHREASLVGPTEDLKQRGLLVVESVMRSPRRLYTLTPRGETYVRALLTVPLPVSMWRVEWPKDDQELAR